MLLSLYVQAGNKMRTKTVRGYNVPRTFLQLHVAA